MAVKTIGVLALQGAFDAHTGGVGAGVQKGIFVKVIGTSTCDMAVLPNTEKVPEIPGLCGIVDGSILPGYYGFEAGQSAEVCSVIPTRAPVSLGSTRTVRFPLCQSRAKRPDSPGTRFAASRLK